MAAAAPYFENKQAHVRIQGLDTLRFFLALWVVFLHLGFLPITFDKSSLAGKVAAGIHGNLFSGPAAVIVFFLISGFCIHYPYRNNQPLYILPYFFRRHLRIWVPIIVAILLGKILSIKYSLLEAAILWSLVAEEIYYLMYPGLLYLKKRIGWRKIILVAYGGAFLVIMQNPFAGDYPSYGLALTWILGLPCWLLGCCLAERTGQASDADKNVMIWNWRLTAWFLSCVCSSLRYHTPIGYPWTLTFFAIFAFFWLEREIVYYQTHRPPKLFEAAGKGSYSIYLFHLLGSALYGFLPFVIPGEALGWFLRISLTLFFCFVFYHLVEKPSHHLARQLAKKLSPSPPVVQRPPLEMALAKDAD